MNHVRGIGSRLFRAAAGLALVGFLSPPGPAAAQSTVSAPKVQAATEASNATKEASTAAVASADRPVLKGLNSDSRALKLSPAISRALRDFRHASTAFPPFCKDWERKLRDRERNNLAHMTWRRQGGSETGTYVGYSAIDSCMCKQARNGVPIGELTYKQFDYVLTGKNVDEAKHSHPRQTSIAPTREIFSWDKGKWYY